MYTHHSPDRFGDRDMNYFKSTITNQSGGVLVQAIAATIIIGIAAVTIMQRSLDINRQLRLPRIKAAQNNVEFALRHFLLQPTTFTGCNSNVGFAASCTLDMSSTGPLERIVEPVPGCAGTVCQVSITNRAFDATTRTFTGKITYSGAEVVVNSVPVSIVVPLEVLQSSSITCSGSTPFFTGFNADGTPNCRGFTGVCGPGQFVKGFSPSNLQVQCQDFPTTAIDCTPGFITSLDWSVGGTITHTCGSRVPPTTIWPPSY